MIRAIVFDLGKVLVDFDYSIAVGRIAARGKMSAQEITRYMSQSTLLPRYESGLLTSEEFFAEVCRITGYRGTVQDFAAAFGDIFVPIPPMIELQRRLRLKGLPAFIFSNTNDFAIRHIREAFPFFRDFDGYILSYEHQVMKPDARLYEVVERVSARRGEEILYFDDRPENAAAGSERGWRSVLHETPEQSRAVVQELGLL